jgi:hypothetical protein
LPHGEEHKKKVTEAGWQHGLDDAGLGVDRFFLELEKSLAEKGGVHMRATELLADLHAMRKSKLEVSGPGGGPIIVATPVDEAL